MVEFERVRGEIEILHRRFISVLLDYSRDWHIVRLLFN